jgi:hypothetical protein
MTSIQNTKITVVRFSLFIIAFLCICATTFSHSALADSKTSDHGSIADFILPQTLQLPNKNLRNDIFQWTQIIARPGKNEQYYASNSLGQIYLFEQGNEQHASLVFNLIEANSENKSSLNLNAFTLHPNFSIKDSSGYRTFYTAHTEAINKTKPTLRIEDKNITTPTAYDAVITEWQFDFGMKAKADLSTKREVLRIPLVNIEDSVTQLSFHPYIKSWNEDFGLLYISLKSTESLRDIPLYSGVLLRINPNQFGLRSYTLPSSNPFLANTAIHDSIYLLGAQKIQQYIWPNKHSEQLLISHHYQNKSLLDNVKQQFISISYGGEDWRKFPSTQTIYQGSHLLGSHSLLSYWGRNSSTLRNKVLILQSPHIFSLPYNAQLPKNEQKHEQVDLQQEWRLPTGFSNSPLIMFKDNDYDLLLLKMDTNAIHRLSQSDKIITAPTQSHSNIGLYALVFFVLIGPVLFLMYRLTVQKKSAKAFVRRQYSRMKLNTDNDAIRLFKRHDKQSERAITLLDITSLEVLLSDNAVFQINANDIAYGFNSNKEQELRDIFQREQTDKMIDGKIRKISLCITEQHKLSSITCLYLRKGSDRITKNTYFAVVDEVIDWCWLISKTTNPKNTDERPEPQAEINAEESAVIEPEKKRSLHQQADNIRPSTHAGNEPVCYSGYENIESESNKSDEVPLPVTAPIIEPTKEQVIGPTKQEPGMVDAELVNALEKLVQLKQQGFLSLEEFTQAKAKLLNSLIDS